MINSFKRNLIPLLILIMVTRCESNLIDSLNKRLLQSLSNEYNSNNPCVASQYDCNNGACVPSTKKEKFTKFRVSKSINYISCSYTTNNIECVININPVNDGVSREIHDPTYNGDLSSLFIMRVNDGFQRYIDRNIDGVGIQIRANKSESNAVKMNLRSNDHWLMDNRSYNWSPFFSMVINFRDEVWKEFLQGSNGFWNTKAQMTVIHELLHDFMKNACSRWYSATHAGTSNLLDSLNKGNDFNIFTYGETFVNSPEYAEIKMVNLHVIAMILSSKRSIIITDPTTPKPHSLCHGVPKIVEDKCKLMEKHQFMIKLPDLSKLKLIHNPVVLPIQFKKYEQPIGESCHCKLVYQNTGLVISQGSSNTITQDAITYTDSQDSLMVLYLTQTLWHQLSSNSFEDYSYHPEFKNGMNDMIAFSLLNFVKLTNELCGLIAVFQG
jgi:hypothetical protein